MNNEQDLRWSRREVLGGLARVGTAGLLGLLSGRLTADFLGIHPWVVERKQGGDGA